MRKIFFLLLTILFCGNSFASYSSEPTLNNNDQYKFDYFFLQGLRLKQKGELTNAFNCIQYALQIDTTSAAALFEISNYYFEMNEQEAGIDYIEKAVKYNSGNTEYKLALADRYRETENYQKAIAIYEELLQNDPQKTDLYFYLSNLYLQKPTFNMEKAITSLDGLENNIGINETISLQKFQLFRLSNNKEKAIEEIDKLITKFPTEAKYRIILGDYYLEENDKATALSFYQKAEEIDPNNPYYFIAMANYYEKEGDQEKAAEEIDKALKNPTLDIETKITVLGKYIQSLYKNKKDIESGNILFETLMEQHSQDKELNMMYGQFLLSQNKTKEAKFQFQVVTEAMPEEISAWTPLLEIALKEENADEVIAICDKALIHFPNVPEFYFYKATALYQYKKNYLEALDVYKQGLEFIEASNKALLSTFHGQIGDIYYHLGNKEEAFINYEKALQYNDKNVLILNNYAYQLSVNKENLDKAERMAATAVQLLPDNSTFLDTYAWIFFQKGDYSLAKFYIESAISKEKNPDAVLIEHYGDILYKNGDVEKAVEQWEKALEIYNNNENKKKDIDNLLKKIKDKVYYNE